MKPNRKTSTCLFIALLFMLWPNETFAGDASYEEIFKWVAAELKIAKNYPMPKIKNVPKKTLQELFTALL